MLTSEQIKEINEGTMMETLGIEYLELKEGYVYARMFVKRIDSTLRNAARRCKYGDGRERWWNGIRLSVRY